MNVPRTTSGAECPGIGFTRPSGENLPLLGPTMYAPTRPERPPTMCTIPDPAKSSIPTPKSFAPFSLHGPSQPSVDQPQCTTSGYTNADKKNEYPRYAMNLVRSATDPETIV